MTEEIHIVFTAHDLRERLLTSKPYSTIVFDEREVARRD